MILLAMALSAAWAGAGDPIAVAERHLESLAVAAGNPAPVEFRARRVLPWAGGTTVRVGQEVGGLPLEDGDLAVVLDGSGRVRRVAGRVAQLEAPRRSPGIEATDAEATAQAAVGLLGGGALWPARAEAVVFVRRDGVARVAWGVDVSTADPPATFRVVVDGVDGGILRSRPTSFEVGGDVYPHGPALSGLRRAHLSGLESSAVLSGQYADVWSCDEWTLEDGLFGVTQCHSVTRQAQPDGDGNYLYAPAPTATEDPFGEVQLYYHLDRVSRVVEARFGFAHDAPMRGIVNFPMENAFFGDFDGDGRGDVSFGHDGAGVDFGYDPDVVYHEFGHSIVEGVATLPFMGADEYGMLWDGGSLNEGMADSFAMFLNGDPFMGEHAGNVYGEGGLIRDLSGPRRCPDDLMGEVHADGEIWGSLVWSLADDSRIGLEATKDLVFGALTTWTYETTWSRAGASLVAAADDLLEAGAIDAEARAAVEAHVAAYNLVECGRVVPLDGGTAHSMFVLNAGLSGDFEFIPSGVQLSFGVPADATGFRLAVTEYATSNEGLGYRVYVRRGAPVGHRVEDLSLLGMETAIPETFDFFVDAGDVGDVVELTVDSDPPLVPGETYYFAFAGRNDGGIAFFDFTFGLLTAEASLFDPAPESPGGCGCAGASGFGLWPLLVAVASIRRPKSRRGREASRPPAGAGRAP